MKVNAMLLGKLIKAARVAENMSSADFSREAGISPSALTRLENPPKIDFRVSYDTLLNALELVGTFPSVKNKELMFDEFLKEANAKETINLFLSFANREDYLDAYIYESTAPTSEYVYKHMAEMQDSLQDVLNNHFRTKEFQRFLTDACEKFMEGRLAEYKDDPETYSYSKIDFPNKFVVTEDITDREDMGMGYGMRNEIDYAFGELLSHPSVENAVVLAVKMMKELG